MSIGIRSNKLILLTGAGFTHNFGAPLANHLWAMIFNHPKVQASEKIRTALLNDIDFESVYQKILEGSYSDIEKDAIKSSVEKAYLEIDNTLTNFHFHVGSPYPINIYKVQQLINAFNGSVRESGFFFTLNQDLFIEHQYYNGVRPLLPGISPQSWWFTTQDHPPLGLATAITLPSETDLNKLTGDSALKERFLYLKLHGSCNWVSSLHDQKMVIGGGKPEQIKQEPLLNLYYDIFQAVFSKSK